MFFVFQSIYRIKGVSGNVFWSICQEICRKHVPNSRTEHCYSLLVWKVTASKALEPFNYLKAANSLNPPFALQWNAVADIVISVFWKPRKNMVLLQTGWLSPGHNTWQGRFKDRVPKSKFQFGCVSAVLVRPMHWPTGKCLVSTPQECSPREKSGNAMGTGQPPKYNKIVLSRSEVLGSSRYVAETCQMLSCYEKHYHNSPESIRMKIHSLYLQEPAKRL